MSSTRRSVNFNFLELSCILLNLKYYLPLSKKNYTTVLRECPQQGPVRKGGRPPLATPTKAIMYIIALIQPRYFLMEYRYAILIGPLGLTGINKS